MFLAVERTRLQLDRVGLRCAGCGTAPDGNRFPFLESLTTDNRADIVVARDSLRRAEAATR